MTEQSREYAEALYALAAESGAQAPCLEGLELAVALLKENPEYRELLASPALPREERDGLLEQALGAAVPEPVLSFLCLLCAHGRIRSLEACVEDYRQLHEAALSLSTARVTSAVALTSDQQERLRRGLEQRTGRTIRLECWVDSRLLGGITVEIDGKVLDGSLRHRLQDMKEVMEQ